jgi:hypothetical protein
MMMQRAEIITIERRRRWGLSEKQDLSRSATGCTRAGFFPWHRAAWGGRLVEESGRSLRRWSIPQSWEVGLFHAAFGRMDRPFRLDAADNIVPLAQPVARQVAGPKRPCSLHVSVPLNSTET